MLCMMGGPGGDARGLRFNGRFVESMIGRRLTYDDPRRAALGWRSEMALPEEFRVFRLDQGRDFADFHLIP